MTQLKLTINLDNDAFQPTPEAELVTIFAKLSSFFERNVVEGHGVLRDSNGNQVGFWTHNTKWEG